MQIERSPSLFIDNLLGVRCRCRHSWPLGRVDVVVFRISSDIQLVWFTLYCNYVLKLVASLAVCICIGCPSQNDLNYYVQNGWIIYSHVVMTKCKVDIVKILKLLLLSDNQDHCTHSYKGTAKGLQQYCGSHIVFAGYWSK